MDALSLVHPSSITFFSSSGSERHLKRCYSISQASTHFLAKTPFSSASRKSSFSPAHIPSIRPWRPSFQVQATKKTFSSFDDLLKTSEVPLLVDFYATWCGPCQFMVPILDEVGRTLKDEIRIVKVDTEKYPNIASRYGVQALPTFILFQDGKPVDRVEGALPAPDLVSRIQTRLASSKSNARDS